MHEPPRLGKVKFDAEPVQVMMTTSALLAPGAPVMLSVSLAVTALPSDSCDALSVSNAQLPAQVCSALRRQQLLKVVTVVPSALTVSFWLVLEVPRMAPCLQCSYVTRLGSYLQYVQQMTRMASYVQVLLSEEVSGSLRKLRPTAALTRDRFKSLQRQGIIEPRVAAKGRKQPKRVSYTQGERADNAEAGMEEIRALQNKRKQK